MGHTGQNLKKHFHNRGFLAVLAAAFVDIVAKFSNELLGNELSLEPCKEELGKLETLGIERQRYIIYRLLLAVSLACLLLR